MWGRPAESSPLLAWRGRQWPKFGGTTDGARKLAEYGSHLPCPCLRRGQDVILTNAQQGSAMTTEGGQELFQSR